MFVPCLEGFFIDDVGLLSWGESSSMTDRALRGAKGTARHSQTPLRIESDPHGTLDFFAVTSRYTHT